jgi:hypothetical protein
MRQFIDTEHDNKKVCEYDLKCEHFNDERNHEITVDQYINNCLVQNGGTLEEVTTDIDRYITGYHMTKNGHCWISGVTGGYVETDDRGRYFRNMDKALKHRIDHILSFGK